MKKLLAFLLAFAMVFALVSCGNEASSQNETTDKLENETDADDVVVRVAALKGPTGMRRFI